MLQKQDIPKFIEYMQNHYQYAEDDRLNIFICDYIKLDYHVSKQDLFKKEIIDNVFTTLFSITLEDLIKKFKMEKSQTLIESNESKLRKRIADLEQTCGELRDSYWNVKQQLIKLN